MKRFLKRYLLLILSLAAVFTIVGSTYAYLIATDNEIINSFKFAQVDTSTHEKTDDYNQKEVTFSNDGISSVYIRARVLVSMSDAEAVSVKYNAEPDANGISIMWNSTNWEWDKNGEWFYYKGILAGKPEGSTEPGQVTEPLITEVRVGSEVDQSAKFEVEVYQESVIASAENWYLDAAKAAFQ